MVELSLVRTVDMAGAAFPVAIAIDDWDPIRLPWRHSPYTVQIAPGVHHAAVKVGVIARYSRSVRFVVCDGDSATLLIDGDEWGAWRTTEPGLVVHDGPPKPQEWPPANRPALFLSGLGFLITSAALILTSELADDTSATEVLLAFIGGLVGLAGMIFAEHFMRMRRLREARRLGG